MKKTLPLLVVGILVLSGLGAIALSNDDEEIIQSETIIFSQPILIENDDYYEIELSESTSFTSGFGNPALPVVTKQYIFPFGTEITQVDVEYETFSQQKISKPIKPPKMADKRSWQIILT